MLAPYRAERPRAAGTHARRVGDGLGRDPLPPGMDEAEVAAFTDLVHAFLLYHPTRPLNIMVGWCVNDYQIDVAGADGRAEYKRIIDRAAELGAQYLLYAPSNTSLSRREDSLDDWSWEHVLWLGLGQKIRAGAWNVKSGEIPAERARDGGLRRHRRTSNSSRTSIRSSRSRRTRNGSFRRRPTRRGSTRALVCEACRTG